MKLSVAILLLSVLNASAGLYSQTKLTLNVNNRSVKEVFKEIEQQSRYRFLYNEEYTDLDRNVKLEVVNSKVENVLDKLFAKANVTYRVLDNDLIVITPSESALKQQHKISGKVTDASTGEALPGVSVIVEGTTIGATTDLEGKFSLDVSSPNVQLIFSYVGYNRLTQSPGGASVLDIKLVPDIKQLSEVIVIGYGTARRQDYSGSVSSVKVENSPISQVPNLNALEALKGNVPGLDIGATNSAGGQPSMQIRGQNSISGNNDPLIVLDGVIFLGSLSDINPNDIASFDVLKDAVSAAAYGSRSANGVIAITTKKGHLGKPVVTFNTSAGIQTWQNEPVVMKGAEWIKVVNARNQYAEGTTSWMKAGELANLAAGKETDWLDQVTRTGKIQNYQIAVSGAGENVNYYLSASYDKNKSIVVGDDFNRISLLGKVDTKITSWLEIGIDGSFSRRDYSGVAANIGEAEMESPYGVEYRDSLGHLEKYPYTQSSINPLWGVNDGTRDNSDIRRNFRLNSYAVVKIPWIEGLSYRLNYLNNLDKVEQGNFYHEGYFVKEGAGLDRYTQSTLQGFLTNANGNLYNTTTTSYVIDNILNYKHSFSKHNVEVTLVATRDYSKYTAMNMTGSDFASNGNTSLGVWGLHKATVQKFDLNGTKTTNIGYLGRLTYSFNDKYFLTGSFRRDGASVFGANKKWGNFAAAGAAWKISNEEFLKGFDPLSSLKLKLSWGQNGSQGISPYGTLSTVSNGASGGIDYEFSSAQGTIVYGLNQTTLGNADLAWEKTETWNTGFESSWLKDRLFVDMDLYLSKTRDQHFTRNIPVMTGFKTIQTAMGQVNNSGIELDIKSVNVQNKDWTWNTGITYWKNNNKLVKLYGQDLNGDGKEDDDISNGLFVGKSLGAIYGYEQDGIVQTTDADYIALTGAAPGAPKYKDIDGVAGITSADRKILGYTKENFRMGMSNEISYKNFDLYVMVAGVFGGNNHYLKSNTSAFMTSGTGRFNDNTISKPYWTPENPSNKYPSAYFSGDSRYQALQSRGFVRVQDVTLTYTLQKNWIQKAHINNMKIFISAKNLATFTNWVGGDPEVGTTVRENTLPVPSTYTIGANLSF